MSAKDRPVSQPANDKFRSGWDLIQWKIPVAPTPVKDLEKEKKK